MQIINGFFHCIIHQHMLCKSVLKVNNVFEVTDVVTKIVIVARVSNHREFVALFEEHETEHI